MSTLRDTNIVVAKPLPLTGTRNTRDLGGYIIEGGSKTRTHVFLRSDSPANLTNEDIEALKAYGVRCVVDLRTETEMVAFPSRLKDVMGIDYYHVSIADGIASEGFQLDKIPKNMGEMYVRILSEQSEVLARLIHIFASYKNETVLFNCAAGKDRTGVVAMLLLLLAGVGEETIIADYSMTEVYMTDIFDQQRKNLEQTYGFLPPDYLFSSAPKQIETALKYLTSHYGSAEDYLKRAGASIQDLEIVKKMLISK
ncbi:tyrosine-protein phosphatase [Scatolibacter rhodanostii]|uniref:tyrosine-protein phosphatase n=1 Tax=Scatolibacter rhodanostii TaxID=2014781 RepID=UPI000C076FD3|nr:tyrosine-protein phosphatase [Scatolibacter rhodanostii]